jgi:hypothetical protein
VNDGWIASRPPPKHVALLLFGAPACLPRRRSALPPINRTWVTGRNGGSGRVWGPRHHPAPGIVVSERLLRFGRPVSNRCIVVGSSGIARSFGAAPSAAASVFGSNAAAAAAAAAVAGAPTGGLFGKLRLPSPGFCDGFGFGAPAPSRLFFGSIGTSTSLYGSTGGTVQPAVS